MRIAALVLALLAAGSSLQARVWGEPSGWMVLDVDEGCGFTREFEGTGATNMAVVQNADGAISLSISNYGWSIRQGDEFRVAIVLGDKIYGGPARGFVDGIRKGLSMIINEEILGQIGTASGIRLFRVEGRDQTLIDDLGLDGTSAAIGLMRRCLVTVRARVARERADRERLAHIPANPFAEPRSAAPMSAARARPRLDISSYIADADYPAAALRSQEQGTVRFRLDVGSDGRVTGCTVITSSGSTALDAATCRIMRGRVRFAPARDAAGNLIEDTFDSQVVWRLNRASTGN